MVKNILSLSVASAILISVTACGSTTTSLYRGAENIGDQVSDSISKIIDDADKNMNNMTNDYYSYDNTYDTANRIYTTGNGYINDYSRLNSDYNYNGVSLRSSETANDIDENKSSKLQNNLSNIADLEVDEDTISKTNTITSIPTKDSDDITSVPTILANEKDTVAKSDTITSISGDYNATDNNYFDDFADSLSKIVDEYTSDDVLNNAQTNSNSINKVLNSTDNTVNDMANNILDYDLNSTALGIVENDTNDVLYPVGSTMDNNKQVSNANAMIIA